MKNSTESRGADEKARPLEPPAFVERRQHIPVDRLEQIWARIVGVWLLSVFSSAILSFVLGLLAVLAPVLTAMLYALGVAIAAAIVLEFLPEPLQSRLATLYLRGMYFFSAAVTGTLIGLLLS